TPCSCEVKMEPTLSQALHLLNGDTVNAKIKQGGVLDEVMKARPTAEERLTDLYLRCLSRKPTPDELAKLAPVVSQAPDQAQALGDVFWALLNSREFLFNH
ncbi:hypothetical protein HK102_010092, partial [Quaeritorhiza haematococci]